MGISIYIRNVATESEVADIEGSTATPQMADFMPSMAYCRNKIYM